MQDVARRNARRIDVEAEEAKNHRARRVQRENNEKSVRRSGNGHFVVDLTDAEEEHVVRQSEEDPTGLSLVDRRNDLLNFKTSMYKKDEALRISELRKRRSENPDLVPYVRPEWSDTSGLLSSVLFRGGVLEPLDTLLDNTGRELHTCRHEVGFLDDPVNAVVELTWGVKSSAVSLVHEIELEREWTFEFVQAHSLVTIVRAAVAVRAAVRGDVEDIDADPNHRRRGRSSWPSS